MIDGKVQYGLKLIKEEMQIQQIEEDLRQAQLNRDELKTSTLRMLLSEIRNAQIQKGGDLGDLELLSVISKEAKKRRESVAAFRQGNREDLAQKEEAELKVLEGYLPEGLSTEELTKLVEDSINEIGAKSLQDMGRVMSSVMAKVAGRADGAQVSSLVKEKLAAQSL